MGSVLCAVQRNHTFPQLKGCGRLPLPPVRPAYARAYGRGRGEPQGLRPLNREDCSWTA